MRENNFGWIQRGDPTQCFELSCDYEVVGSSCGMSLLQMQDKAAESRPSVASILFLVTSHSITTIVFENEISYNVPKKREFI